MKYERFDQYLPLPEWQGCGFSYVDYRKNKWVCTYPHEVNKKHRFAWAGEVS